MEKITKPVAGQAHLQICMIHIKDGTVRRTGTGNADSGSMDYSEWDADKVDAINKAAAIIATETVVREGSPNITGYESGNTESVKTQLDSNLAEKKAAIVAERERIAAEAAAEAKRIADEKAEAEKNPK